ncbi:hypothetical protein D3C86_1734010 [compost metagenome]
MVGGHLAVDFKLLGYRDDAKCSDTKSVVVQAAGTVQAGGVAVAQVAALDREVVIDALADTDLDHAGGGIIVVDLAVADAGAVGGAVFQCPLVGGDADITEHVVAGFCGEGGAGGSGKQGSDKQFLHDGLRFTVSEVDESILRAAAAQHYGACVRRLCGCCAFM